MHPAYSIIFFTTASGMGYGLLAVLGLAAAMGIVPPDRWLGFVGLGLALALVTAGLLSSTFHLGHPERAWRAVSQWRSSWLSREGVMALLTYIPAGLLGIGWVFLETTTGFWALCGIAAAAGAVVTVFCTAMIYASLKAIPRWYTPWVPANYLTLALMTGALGYDAVTRLFGIADIRVTLLAIASVVLAAAVKVLYWRHIDRAPAVSTSATATGLVDKAPVRMFEAPHTSENYLQREMGFRVARKHAAKLRTFCLLFAFGVPLLFSVPAMAVGGGVAAALSILAAISALGGTLIERWLFFAEAKHVVTLYYGEEAV